MKLYIETDKPDNFSDSRVYVLGYTISKQPILHADWLIVAIWYFSPLLPVRTVHVS